MPTYTFHDKKTGETFDSILSLSEREKFLAENPHVEQLIVSAPGIVDSWRVGVTKPDNGWRDVLRSIKKANKGSNINTFD